MALIAEEIVQEWLHQQGFFTLRGARIGGQEMDILALRERNGVVHRRHIEIQVSHRPVSWVTPVAVEDRRGGRQAKSAASRTQEEIGRAAREWKAKKFELSAKESFRQKLSPGDWSHELVLHQVKHDDEPFALHMLGIKLIPFALVLRDLQESRRKNASAGGHLLDLIFEGHPTYSMPSWFERIRALTPDHS